MNNPKTTIEEREFFQPVKAGEAQSGFKSRGQNRLGHFRKPVTSTSLECSHLLRARPVETAAGYPTLDYRMWLEAGRRLPPNFQRPDDNYNGNIWRNFRRSYGLHSAEDVKTVDRKVSLCILMSFSQLAIVFSFLLIYMTYKYMHHLTSLSCFNLALHAFPFRTRDLITDPSDFDSRQFPKICC